MSYLQNFNFAWGVGIFSGEEHSESYLFSGRFKNIPERKMRNRSVRQLRVTR